MSRHITTDDVAILLERLATGVPGRVVELHNGFVHAEWDGIPIDARVTGTNIGKRALALATALGAFAELEGRVAISKLLEHLAGTAVVRLVVEGETAILETRVIPDDLDEARLDSIVAWRVTELCTVACAWRRLLGIRSDGPAAPVDLHTLAALVRATPVLPQKALLVATVGFAVAGADGNISPREAAKLRAWMREIPSFAALDLHRVIDAIATLVDDPARTLLEALRGLDPRERLLAWSLANDMAHADGFPTEEERRYLSNVASIFQLSPHDVAPLVADAQERSIRHETIEPPPLIPSILPDPYPSGV